MHKKHIMKYRLMRRFESVTRYTVISLRTVSSILIILFSISSCSDIPYTNNMLTPEDVDRYLFAPDADTFCLTNGVDSKCVTLVPKSGDPRLPIIHIYPRKVTYVFYHDGVPVVRAERPRDDIITHPDGTVTQPDGTVTQPDGTVTQPDGTVTQPDGTVTQPDGTVIQPDGTVTQPDGTVIQPDGTVIHPDDEDKGQGSGRGGVDPRDEVDSGTTGDGNIGSGSNNEGKNNGETNNGNGNNNGGVNNENNNNENNNNENNNNENNNNENNNNENNNNENNNNKNNNNENNNNREGRSNPNPSGHNPPDNVTSHYVYRNPPQNDEEYGWIVWIYYPHNYVKDDNNDGIEDNPRGLGDEPINPRTGPGTSRNPYGFTLSVSGGDIIEFSQTSGTCTDEREGLAPTLDTIDNRKLGQDNRDDSDNTPCNDDGSDYSVQLFVESSAVKITLTIRWTHGIYARQTQTFNIMKEISMKEWHEVDYDPNHTNQDGWP